MKLLFITQKMDKEDDVLGAYHQWAEVLSKKFERVTVICLYRGKVELPKNVKVLSLGKESGTSRLKYVYRFFLYIWQQRKNYDSVFVHMNAEYVIWGWWVWKLLRKQYALWYNHTYGNWKARVAFLLAEKIFHTSPYAFSSSRKKSVRMPAGIDTEMFKHNEALVAKPNSVLYIGRISRVKNVDILIEAVGILHSQGVPIMLDIYGSPANDAVYYKALQELAAPLEKRGIIRFAGSVPNYKSPAVFNEHEVCVNLTPRGNYDKTVLESMACEKISVVSSEAFKGTVLNEYIFKERDAEDLARVLKRVFELLEADKKTLGKKMREYVEKNHSLEFLTERLYAIYDLHGKDI